MSLMMRYPMTVQSVISGAVCVLGDTSAQYLEYGEIRDFKRSIKMFGFGVLTTPPQFLWFKMLDKVFKSGRKLKDTLWKVGVHHVTIAQALNFGFLFYVSHMNHLMSDGDFDAARAEFKAKVNEEWMDVLINSTKLWPFAQFINFWFVPLHYRAIFANSVAALWLTYMSYIAHRERELPSPLDILDEL